MHTNQDRIEHPFEVANRIYLRLQPYKQSILKKSGLEELKSHFYGQIRLTVRIGEVAYDLELPKSREVHNVFHISHPKKAFRHNVIPSIELPPLDEESKMILIPQEVIDCRERTLLRRVIRE